ncbi:hypothetical protein ACTJJB_28070 [Chitinophaga sp. 22536]|uniref:hypothetical protein n=1 Tax=unclassified Chitinophaga TaxID=2619133 RepID=UPI003F83738E
MAFNAYHGVTQTTDNSCGAFSLAAALVHLGATAVPTILNTGNLTQRYTAPGPAALAQRIYQTTGNLLLNLAVPAPTATYQYEEPVDNYNPPSALAYIASQFGLTTNNVIVYYTNQAAGILQNIQATNVGAGPDLLETEIDLITTQPAYGLVNGPVNYTQKPGAQEAHLLVVENLNHTIALNDTEVYDPGYGYVGPYTLNNNGPLPLTQISFTLPSGLVVDYDFSGVWIKLKA